MFIGQIKFRSILLLFLVLQLIACDSYSISEELLNRAIKDKIIAQPQQYMFISISDPVADLDIVITQVFVDLAETEDGKAKIYIGTEVRGDLLVAGKRVEIATHTMISIQSGLLVEEGKVYLSDPQVAHIEIYGSSVNDKLLRSSLDPFHKIIEDALSSYFYVYPVYELINSTFEESIKKSIKSVTVKEDRLLLKFY